MESIHTRAHGAGIDKNDHLCMGRWVGVCVGGWVCGRMDGGCMDL